MELYFAHEYQRALRRERTFRDPLDLLDFSDGELLKNYRFPRQELVNIITLLTPQLERRTRRSHALPMGVQILVAFRFYASGTFQNVLADTYNVTQASVSNIINDVTNVLFTKAVNDTTMASGDQEIAETMQSFYRTCGFPRVVGAIDGSHIPIKAPNIDEEIYVNRKGIHSLNIQAVCNAERKIVHFNVNYPGSTHDSFIWNNCELRTRFIAGEFNNGVLLGDSGYPLESFLMTPYAYPSSESERRFNTAHKTGRVIVEQTFGVLKSRFRCLHKSGGNLQYTPEKSAKITAACIWLHNHCIDRNLTLLEEVDQEVDDQVAIQNLDNNGLNAIGRDERANITNNFFS